MAVSITGPLGTTHSNDFGTIFIHAHSQTLLIFSVERNTQCGGCDSAERARATILLYSDAVVEVSTIGATISLSATSPDVAEWLVL
jgi:hypothetical protein